MGRRLFNGREFSENGWPYVDEAGCTWIEVPGTNPIVRLEIQSGLPAVIMTAYAADHNAFVERLRDGDSACWTPGNKVATSNHPGGTAMDLNWDGPDGKTFRYGIPKERAYPGDQSRNLDEVLAFYEDIIFCGGEWSIRDWMHFQMKAGTFNDPRVGDFIARKIRPDGFSTFRRGGTPGLPRPVLSRADRYALTIITEGQKLGVSPRGNKIAISVGLVESNLQNYANSNDPASMLIPHDAVGHDHMSSGWAQQQPNWGPLECRMDVACAARLFFTCDNGPGTRGLLKIRDRVGRAYDYNDESNSPGFYAQKVQGSAFPDRYDKRYAEAEQIYNRLLLLPPSPPSSEEGFLMALSDAEQREILNDVRKRNTPQKSRSPVREPGEGTVGDTDDQVWDIDANVHLLAMFLAAFLGIPNQVQLLERVAANGETEQARMVAQAILAETADMQDLKQGILAALGRITVATPVVSAPSAALVRLNPIDSESFPEVLDNPRPAPSTTATPQDLLDTLDRLKVFDGSYREKFDQLTTKETENDNT